MIRRMKFTTDRRIEVVNLERLEIADRLEFLDFETNEISRYREKKKERKPCSPICLIKKIRGKKKERKGARMKIIARKQISRVMRGGTRVADKRDAFITQN